MKKHRFNIFPEANTEDYNRLRDDIASNGYDSRQPIVVYQDAIIDGWNRQRACDELSLTPSYHTFQGSDSDAIDFVMRTNKRRNLNKGQWACIAAEADDLLALIREQVEKERRANISETKKDSTLGKKLPNVSLIKPDDQKTVTKAATAFNTNRTYVNQAVKMKEAAPEVFEKVKAGKMTMQDANKAVRAIPTEPWLDDEIERRAKVEAGDTVIANAQRCKNLITWAEKKGLAVQIGRGTPFGNPFIIDKDGDRNAVCDSYRDHYLPNKPSISALLSSLKGKVIVCHCYPKRCHGESLVMSSCENT